ncbi:MAG: DUF6125 family protein [Anaerovoracaceae bacterium]|nr:DUF6125 family protein [Anaerovoracaceae bacterium]
MGRKELENLTKSQLIELIEAYSKNWLAIDGAWFQAVEKAGGMDEAMARDIDAWKVFTVAEARRIKKFLGLPERPGLQGLADALLLRFYSNINEDDIAISGNTLIYKNVTCFVQDARRKKGMEYHPCKSLGIIEYGDFAKTIDDRITCRCLSCYPDVTDETCRCSWEFTLK